MYSVIYKESTDLQWWPKLLEHLTNLKTLTFFCLQNIIYFHNVHETCRWLLWAQQISDEVHHTLLTLIFGMSTFITAAHLSGIVSTYFLRTSTLMLSHAFCNSCNSTQRLSFECTIDLYNLFSNSPQICSMRLRSGLWGASPSFSMFQQIPSISGSSGNSSF